MDNYLLGMMIGFVFVVFCMIKQPENRIYYGLAASLFGLIVGFSFALFCSINQDEARVKNKFFVSHGQIYKLTPIELDEGGKLTAKGDSN